LVKGLFVLLLSAHALFGQTFVALGPDPSSIELGASSRVRLQLAGDGLPGVLSSLPAAYGLEWSLGEPIVRQEVRLIQGEEAAVTIQEWSVTIQANALGSLVIPPFSVLVAGKSLKTEPLTLLVKKDEAAAAFASVASELQPTTVYVGQRFRQVVRTSIDTPFLEAQALQMFRQATDLPLKIELPLSPPIEVLDGIGTSTHGKTLVVGQTIAQTSEFLVRQENEKPSTTFAVERWLVARAPGDHQLAAPVLRFAYATQFTEDLIQGRIPLDRREGTVLGSSEGIRVLKLPPAPERRRFSGAVGTYEIEARLLPIGAEFVGNVRVAVTVKGRGDWEKPRPLELGRLDGLHQLGVTQVPSADSDCIEFHYDFQTLRDLPEFFPALAFTHFDPDRRTYVTAQSKPISLIDNGSLISNATRDTSDRAAQGLHTRTISLQVSRSSESAADARKRDLLWTLCAIAFLLIAALAMRRRIALSDFKRSDPFGYRAAFALESLKRDLKKTPLQDVSLLGEYLSAKLKRKRPASISATLVEDLAAVGIPHELAVAADLRLKHGLASDYGVHPEPASQSGILSLAEAIEQALQKRGAS
jgi:hypothetical protein